MPENYLHRRLALGIIPRMSPQAARFAQEFPVVYEVGALGPDPLFAHGFLRPLGHDAVRELGERLHHQATGAFLSGLLRQGAEGGALLKAYAMGFLCHYAADSTIHPYVYAATGERGDRPVPGSHGTLECGIDGWLYQRDNPRARLPIPPPVAALSGLTAGERLELGEAIAHAARVSHGADLPPGEVARAFADMALLNWLQYSPTGAKRTLAAVVERISGHVGALTSHFVRRRLPEGDVINAGGAPWSSPWEPECIRRESVIELFDAASDFALACVEQAARFFRGECSLGQAEAVIGNRNMASGLDCTP